MSNTSLSKSIIAKLLLGIGCLVTPLLVVILAFLLLPSVRPLIFSMSTFDGAFPAGEYHFVITNKENKPVVGAQMQVFKAGTQRPAFGYPIDNYLSNRDLISNEAGLIIAIHKSRGLEVGGGCVQFLIVFKKCSEIPRYDLVITADGYKPIQFSDDVIYNQCGHFPAACCAKIGA